MFDTAQRFLIRLASVGFLAALLVTASPGDTDAQLTCGWCEGGTYRTYSFAPVGEGIYEVGDGPRVTLHEFPGGGDECGWDGHESATSCARCGGTSSCHVGALLGSCHLLCGAEGDEQEEAVAAVMKIRQSLEVGDVAAVMAVLLKEPTGFLVDFMPEAGRIDLVLPTCSPHQAAFTIPVPPNHLRWLASQLDVPASAAP